MLGEGLCLQEYSIPGLFRGLGKFFEDDYDVPPYYVANNFGEFEERVYKGGYYWACHRGLPQSGQESFEDDRLRNLFIPLFRYINGKNLQSKKSFFIPK